MIKRKDNPAVLNRRKFISAAGVLSLAGNYSGLALAARRVPAAGKELLKAGPYLQFPGTDQITIRWLTTAPCYSWVEYGDRPDQLNEKAQQASYGMTEANNTINAITLRNLQAGQSYYYRICSKSITGFEPYRVSFGETVVSQTYSFVTADPHAKQISFLVFNDIHDRPESFPLLLQYQGKDKQDFILLNGDMFNFQSDEDQLVHHLLQPFAGLFATTPFFFSRGNHEARGKFARQLPQYFNGEDAMFYFSFRYGPVYAIVLDSGEDKSDGDKEYFGLADFDHYREQQREWLSREIEKEEFKKARYKIVFSHIPLYYAGDWHGTLHCREVWGDLFNRAGIDLLISGHTHVYGIHPPVAGVHNYPIVIGGGPRDGKRTLIRVEADHSAFRLTMTGDSGQTVGTLKI